MKGTSKLLIPTFSFQFKFPQDIQTQIIHLPIFKASEITITPIKLNQRKKLANIRTGVNHHVEAKRHRPQHPLP